MIRNKHKKRSSLNKEKKEDTGKSEVYTMFLKYLGQVVACFLGCVQNEFDSALDNTDIF